MKLERTEKLMNEKIKNADLDSYAILVHYGDDEKILFSDNVDEYTYFDVASMGKVLITSTLILQAIGRGLINLESTLGDFFDVADPDKKKITVKQLLTHTSGIKRYPIKREAAEKGADAIIADMLSHPLVFQPDTNMKYSCNGYLLLGYILEKIYGKTLEEIYKENIVHPFGLRRTAFEIGMDEPNAAVCYHWKRGEHEKRFDDNNVLVLGKPGGSGGQQSCLYDMQRFITAVLEKSELLYPKELFELAEKDYTPDYGDGSGSVGERRGLGYVMVCERYPQTGALFPIGSFGHCGHTGQSFFINREKQMYVIILTNATRFTCVKNDFKREKYDDVVKMREEIHNAIYDDLKKEGNLL